MTFEELKKLCEEKRVYAEKLYKDRAADAILKDLKEFKNKYPERLKNNSKGYVLDDNIIVSILDGNLEIEDRRGTPFLWIFEIECGYSYMDTFLQGKISRSVRSVKDPKMEDTVKEVIARLEETISYMQDNEITEYTYSCVDLDDNLDSLESVFEEVVVRDLIECRR